jgi:hypothetical protein
MKRSIVNDAQKRRPGRPATGINPIAGVRLESSFRSEIEAWAAKQEDGPSLAEAMRRLIKIGLGRQSPKKKR